MRYAVVAVLIAGCGGGVATTPLPTAPDAGPFVVPAQITYDTHVTETAGRDCSTEPCPQFLNLQCIAVAGRHECHFVMRPQDACETGFAPLGAATWNRLITRDGVTVCTKECIRFDDRHGVQFWCPQALECVDQVAVPAADGGVELHGGCFH